MSDPKRKPNHRARSSIEQGTCLVITSCLVVANPAFLRSTGRHDPNVRLDETVSSLKAWLSRQTRFQRIVLVDNSGTSLEPMKERVGPPRDGWEVEYLSFETTGYSASKGRSFGELDIMRYALAHSETLASSSHFAKVTGRLFVANTDRILSYVPEDFDCIGRFSHNLTWLASNFVLFRKSFFEDSVLPHALAHVDDHARQYIERVYAQAVLRGIADGRRWYPFPREPLIKGVRGIDSKPYAGPAWRRWIMDLAQMGYHRAFDHADLRTGPHPAERWEAPRSDIKS